MGAFSLIVVINLLNRLDSWYTLSSTSSHYCLKPISRENTNHKIADTSKSTKNSQMSSLPPSDSKGNSSPNAKRVTSSKTAVNKASTSKPSTSPNTTTSKASRDGSSDESSDET